MPWEARPPRPRSCLDFVKKNAAADAAADAAARRRYGHHSGGLACQKSAMAALIPIYFVDHELYIFFCTAFYD